MKIKNLQKKINLMKPPYKTHKFDKNVLPNETVTDKAELLRYFQSMTL